MIWRLLCFALVFKAVYTAPVRKTGKIEPGAVPEEEVNVLMFGVIQFSESLSYVYDSTEKKIAKIIQTLKSHELTLQRLGVQIEKAAEVERQIKDVIRLLQDQMAKQEAQTRMMRDWLVRIEQEEEQLRTKVKKLDTYLSIASPTSIRELQERMKEHSSVLQGLQLLNDFQRERIDSQNEHLLKLQERMPTFVNKHQTNS